MTKTLIAPFDNSTLIAHFHRSKAEAYRDIIHQLDREFRLAINTWMTDPRTNVIGDMVLARLFQDMGCEVTPYDEDIQFFNIYLPHSELQ